MATIRRAASLVDSFDGIVEAASDVATDDEHDPEGHTIAWERQQIAALLDETRITLTGIEAAEQRLDDGLYGSCTTCGLKIAAERLGHRASPAYEISDGPTRQVPWDRGQFRPTRVDCSGLTDGQ